MINTDELLKYTGQLSILFAEDHEELRVSTAEILEKIFKTVDIVSNGKEALDKYINYNTQNSKNYDIVLTDIRMPVMDGIELTENIYQINEKQIIIVLSAFDESEYLLKLINLGIAQFIKKPINYDDLLKVFLNVSKKVINKSSETNSYSIDVYLDKDTMYSKDTKSVKKGEENIYLTKFEIIFLELLTQSPEKIYSNKDIVSHYAASDENINESNIRKLVSKLRKKLPENCIESIYGIGYKIIPYN